MAEGRRPTALGRWEVWRRRLWPERALPLSPWLLLLPALLLTSSLAAALVVIGESSLHLLDRATFRLGEAYSLGNYAELLQRPVYLRIIGRTALAAAIVTAITVALAIPYGYLMVRTAGAGLRKLLLIGLFLPFFLGQVIRAYGWLIVLGKHGLLNAGLTGLGLPDVALIYTYPGVLIGLVQYMLPFAVLLLAPAFTAIPEELELASMSLGGRAWPTFWHIVLPLAKPGWIAAGVVVFTLTMTDFAMPEMMGGGGNDFIANAIYDGFFQLSDAGLGSALAIVLTALGTLAVAVVFTAIGVGTLGYIQSGSAGAAR
ncbi:MAG TPA: ABC transporter permease [Geminicoccaceae bacterium]|nr:ABC transporter permease [Geminicoccaceae bacterium]